MAAKKSGKKEKVVDILTTERSWEGPLLAILSIIVMLLGVYIFDTKTKPNLPVDPSVWILNSELKIKIIAWVLIVVGAVILLWDLWPYLMPSVKELKKITWPKKGTIANHCLRVFGFILFLGVMFWLYELALVPAYEYALKMN